MLQFHFFNRLLQVMARSLRPQFEDALYYITVRGNNRQPLFRDYQDQGHYIELLDRYRERFGCRLYGYILLGNHLHLLLETPRGCVGKFMQCLGTSYVAYFNRRYKRRGTLFEGRYRSDLVAKSDLLDFTRHAHTCKLGHGAGEQRDLKRFVPSSVNQPAVVPSQLQRTDLKKAAEIIQEVRQSLGISNAEDLKERHRTSLARHLAMYLIRKQTLLPLRLIGTLLGVKPAAVAIAVGKMETRVRERAFPTSIENLLKRINLTGTIV